LAHLLAERSREFGSTGLGWNTILDDLLLDSSPNVVGWSMHAVKSNKELLGKADSDSFITKALNIGYWHLPELLKKWKYPIPKAAKTS
jgi:hypothetical protein